jgi:hypothetical protein
MLRDLPATDFQTVTLTLCGRSVLHYAAAGGCAAILGMLIDAQKLVRTRLSSGRPQLSDKACNNHYNTRFNIYNIQEAPPYPTSDSIA